MDVLRQLFEQHFGAALEQAKPVQGELGASGRNIIRLTGGKFSAIGVLYGVREETISILKEREADPASGELAAAMQRIGELSMENELLRSRIERPGPLGRRRSR